MRDDWRYGLRGLAQAPGFAAVAVLTLALGIGANTALFSVVNAVLLNPLPYAQPDQLAAIHTRTPDVARGPITYLNFLDWRRDAGSFAAMAMYRYEDYNYLGGDTPERLGGMMISAGFFPMLGIRPVLGRTFTGQDNRLGAAPVAVISGGLWKRRFGAAPQVLGRGLELNGVLYTVVGVIPDTFSFYGNRREVYTPLGQWNDPSFRDRQVDMSARAVGRLRPGVTLEQAQAEMDGIAAHLAAQYPTADAGVGLELVGLKQDLVGSIRPFLLLLLGAVGLLLLIACVNVANLLLARATGRSLEFAIRGALGASQGRLLRQLLSESLLLAGLGGVLGLALALGARDGVMALLPAGLPHAAQVGLDARVLWFALGVALVSGLAFGCAPALRLARAPVQRALRSGGHGSSGRQRLQGLFVALEVAMALVVLVGAGLMLRTLAALWQIQPGYNPAHAITFDVSLPGGPNTTAAATRARLRQLHTVLASLPGVEAVSSTLGSRPMIHDSSLPFWIQGQPKPANINTMPQALFYLAEADYARAMGLHLERGRFISADDNEHSPPVIVIDDVFAQRYFDGQDPLGQRVNFAVFGMQAKIVGVVGHVKQWGLGADPPAAIEAQFYLPYMQLPEKLMPLTATVVAEIVRTQGEPNAVLPAIRRAVAKMDPQQVVYAVSTLDGLVAGSVATRRAAMVLLGIFGGLALALAAVGIYGVVAYVVGRRTREIGIRMALGSGRGQVLRLVLGDALGMALWGVGLGVAAALGLTRLMAGLLYGVGATDPATYGGVAALLLAVALGAACVPARRAMRVDPLAALRTE